MNRSKKIYALLGVLLAVCVVTFGVSKYEEHKEEIKNSDEVVLELDSDTVTSISWEYESKSLAFHKDDQWLYDEDEAFPVDAEKMNELLELFQAFGASFIIENVEDYSQYGLDDPVCTIKIGTEENTYEILLGSYSTMDEERYVSIGDGNVYLAAVDPLESFDIDISDMIQNDEIPDFDEVTEIRFEGDANYTAVYKEENKTTYSEDDVYFVEKEGEEVALDTENVEDYLDVIASLNLGTYVSYNASDEEIAFYGLDAPELTVTVQYRNEDGVSKDTFVMDISRAKDEKEKAESEEDTDSDSEEDIEAYIRIGESKIIYEITSQNYDNLMKASYDDLRHQKLVWADFSDISKLDISLEGKDYVLTSEEKDDEITWYYQNEEVELAEFKSAFASLTATEFTEKEPTGKEEISLTVHINNENDPEVRIKLYRYDGNSCLAVVDGEPTAFIDRSAVVDLIEAVNAIVL